MFSLCPALKEGVCKLGESSPVIRHYPARVPFQFSISISVSISVSISISCFFDMPMK